MHARLSDAERYTLPPRVLAVLQPYQGRERALTAGSIALLLGMNGKYDDRKVRLAIAILIEQGHPIAASLEGAPGFYWVATQEEARQYLLDLKLRVSGIWKRYRDFSRAAERHFNIPYEQMPLELQEAP